jgi:hypothetical protein
MIAPAAAWRHHNEAQAAGLTRPLVRKKRTAMARPRQKTIAESDMKDRGNVAWQIRLVMRLRKSMLRPVKGLSFSASRFRTNIPYILPAICFRREIAFSLIR